MDRSGAGSRRGGGGAGPPGPRPGGPPAPARGAAGPQRGARAARRGRRARVRGRAVALQCAREETTSRIAAHAARVGAAATDEAIFAWLRFEADPEFGERGSLRLTLWPGGGERVLALGDTHGEKLHW